MALALEPRDATLTVETLSLDGNPAPFFLGANKIRSQIPATLELDDSIFRVEQMSLLFGRSSERSIAGAAGAYLGIVGFREQEDVEVDERTRERLRELGYLN